MPRLDDFSIKTKMMAALAPVFVLTLALGLTALQRRAGAAPDGAAQLWIIAALGTAALLSALATALAIFGISRPLLRLAGTMEKLAAHDRAAEIEGLGRKDEIGRIATSLQRVKERLIEAEQHGPAQARTQKEKERSQQTIEDHIAAFDRRRLREMSGRLADAAAALSATAGTSRAAMAFPAPSGAGAAQVRTVASAADRLNREALHLQREVDRFLDCIGPA